MKYSYHVHSNHSDGKKSIKEIIDYAKQIRLNEIGFSDHFHLNKNDVLIPGDMGQASLDRYVEEVLHYSSSKDPIVKLGLEVEFNLETVQEVKKIIQSYPFDYVIGSVHIVDNNIIIDWSVDRLPSNFCSDIMKRYWYKIQQMAKSRVFDIVGHLDLTKKFGLQPKIDLSEDIDLALKAIKDADMTVEVNTSGFFNPCKEQYPSEDILKKCKELEIPIIVTSDAHVPEHLTRDFDKAFRLLKDIGYTKQAYFIKRERFFTSF